jgi:hypothetical protein
LIELYGIILKVYFIYFIHIDEKRKTKKKRLASELAEGEGHLINSKQEFER